MKRMKLKDVEAITGVKGMTVEAARKLANPGFGCAQQALALSMMTRLNTPIDWLRLQACLTFLKKGKPVSRGGAVQGLPQADPKPYLPFYCRVAQAPTRYRCGCCYTV